MIDPLSNALKGLQVEETRLATAAEKVSKGDLSAENIVDVKVQTTNVKAQAVVIKKLAETEDEILDILA